MIEFQMRDPITKKPFWIAEGEAQEAEANGWELLTDDPDGKPMVVSFKDLKEAHSEGFMPRINEPTSKPGDLVKPVPQPPKPQTKSDVAHDYANKALGVGETVATIGTGGLASLLGKVHAIKTAGEQKLINTGNAIFGEDTWPSPEPRDLQADLNQIQEKFTYIPRGEYGQDYVTDLADITAPISRGEEYLAAGTANLLNQREPGTSSREGVKQAVREGLNFIPVSKLLTEPAKFIRVARDARMARKGAEQFAEINKAPETGKKSKKKTSSQIIADLTGDALSAPKKAVNANINILRRDLAEGLANADDIVPNLNPEYVDVAKQYAKTKAERKGVRERLGDVTAREMVGGAKQAIYGGGLGGLSGAALSALAPVDLMASSLIGAGIGALRVPGGAIRKGYSDNLKNKQLDRFFQKPLEIDTPSYQRSVGVEYPFKQIATDQNVANEEIARQKEAQRLQAEQERIKLEAAFTPKERLAARKQRNTELTRQFLDKFNQ